MEGSTRSTASKTDDYAIYHEIPPTIILLLRMFNFIVLVMAVISFIICLVEGGDSPEYYLLAANTIISGCVGIVVNWWYKRGDLDPVKFWFIFLIGAVIIFQCITTDIFIFRTVPPNPPPLTPAHTTPMGNFTRVTYNWITLNTAGSTKPQLHDDVTVLP